MVDRILDPSVDATAGWGWLNGPTPPDASTSATNASAADPAPAFARCFAGPDGQRVLDTLRAMTLGRALGPDVPDAALRHLEGQRHLVAVILALTARGQRA